MSYHYLTTFERGRLEAMYQEGHRIRFIAVAGANGRTTSSWKDLHKNN